MELLNSIQQHLKAPKNQFNKFGGYKYRNCEDILEALKPLLGKGSLVLRDELVQLGERYYVKATATLHDGSKEIASATAYARESLDKKGMDAAQITGAASSYARKYALNGLFLIDDTQDADTQDNTEKREPMRPYSVSRKVPAADDEAGGAVMKEDVSDEVEEIQREGIKDMMRHLKKPLSKKAIKELTGLEYVPANFDQIYKKLKIELEKTDPLETVFSDDK